MAKFSDLTEQDRVQYVKNGFILILEQLAIDISKLNNYIKLEKPKPSTIVLEAIEDRMSEEEKTRIAAKNTIAQSKFDEENKKKLEEYNAKEAHYNDVKDIISKLSRKEGCVCATCINLNITNVAIPKSLEFLIDFARKKAEEQAY